MGVCCMAQEIQTGVCINLEQWDGWEMGGRFKREGIYVYQKQQNSVKQLSFNLKKKKKKKHWSGLPCPSPGDLLNSGVEPRSPILQMDSLPSEQQGKHKNTWVVSLFFLLGNFPTQESNWGLLHCRLILFFFFSFFSSDWFFTSWVAWEAICFYVCY